MSLIKPLPFKLRKFIKGDVIVSDGQIGIFESLGHHPDGGSHNDDSYFFVQAWCWLFDPVDDTVEFYDGYIYNDGTARLATKREMNYLFQKINEQHSDFVLNKIKYV